MANEKQGGGGKWGMGPDCSPDCAKTARHREQNVDEPPGNRCDHGTRRQWRYRTGRQDALAPPAELRRFKSLEHGTPLIKGRKPFVSFPVVVGERSHTCLARKS